MQIRALETDWDRVPPEVEPFVSPTQTFITPGKVYYVYALSMYVKVLFVLILDDLDTPVFIPAWLFEVVSSNIPAGWVCNLMAGVDVDLILGPEFLARDLQAYNSMIDQESDQLERFWHYVKGE